MTLRIASSIAAILVLAAGAAEADTLTPPVSIGGTLTQSQGFVSTAPGQTPTTVTGTGVNGDGLGVAVNDLTAAGAGSFLFSQTLTAPNGSFPAASTINGNPYGFITSYVIDVTPSMANAFVFSLNLSSTSGIDDLTARLYEYKANGVQNLTLGTAGVLATGTLDSWSASVNPVGPGAATTTLAPTDLTNGGEFVLEVAGLETGSVNGTLSGALNITPISPVPLPATLPLLLSGLGGFGFWGSRRQERARRAMRKR
jgi:hypothetical protein